MSPDAVAVTGDTRPADELGMRQLFFDVARRLMALQSPADAGRSPSTEELDVETEQSTVIPSMIDSVSGQVRLFPSVDGGALSEQRRRLILDVDRYLRTPSYVGLTLTSDERRSRGGQVGELDDRGAPGAESQSLFSPKSHATHTRRQTVADLRGTVGAAAPFWYRNFFQYESPFRV